MAQKQLKDIKHGQRIVDMLEQGTGYFVADIQRITGLDAKSLRVTLYRLLKNGHLDKGEHGQLVIPSTDS